MSEQPQAAVDHKHTPTQVHEVSFTSYPKLLFIWPVIVFGILFYFLAPAMDPEALGWMYIAVLALVFLTLGVDVERNYAIFWLVLLAMMFFLGMWLKEWKQITIFGDIARMLDKLDVKYDRALGLAVSIVLAIPFSVMLGWSRLNDRWRITHNEFEHYALGRMDDSLGRGAKTIRTSYPDVLELVLGLAGTLTVYDARGKEPLRKIEHVMFLPFVRAKLNKILEQTAVTSTTSGEEEEGS